MAKASSKIGNILKDEGNEYVDEISTQQNIDNLHVRTPRDVKIDRDDGGPPETQVKYLKKKICRSTPYLDHEAGLLFPVSELEKAPPNSIIHQIGDREESSILGGFIFGNGREELKLPFKDKADLRLQLADGFCLYKKKGDFLYIQLLDTKFDEIPTQDNAKVHIYLDKEGNVKINTEKAMVEIDSDGKINIIGQSDILISSDGKVDIDSGGEITLDGVSVKLQGGGNKLSHADHKHGYTHTHTTGNIGMPIPPQTHIPGVTILTDQHLPIQGTTTTEAE